MIARKNARRADAVAIGIDGPRPLPRHRTTDFSIATVTVTRSGTIRCAPCFTPCPRAWSACRLKVHIYDDRLVCYLGTTPVLTVARGCHFKRHGPRVRVVDYRHLIGPLVRKPQAFRHSVFRDELFPRPVFRRAWEVLDAALEPRKACRVYVGLLHLAAMHGCEAALADHLAGVLDAGGTPDLEAARAAVAPPVPDAAPHSAVIGARSRRYDGCCDQLLDAHPGEAA